jgi:predicted RNA-binding protein with TRAM domain
LVNGRILLGYAKNRVWATVLKADGQEPENNQKLDAKTELSTFHGLKEGDETELEITQKSRDGRGLARLNGLLIFVSGASPGERVKVRIVKLGVRHAEAEVIKRHRVAIANARA